MCSPSVVEPVVNPLLEGAGEVTDFFGITDSKPPGPSGFVYKGTNTEKEPPKAPQTDPEQMAKIRAAGDDERRRALLRIGNTSTNKTGSLGLPGDPFTATRKLLGG